MSLGYQLLAQAGRRQSLGGTAMPTKTVAPPPSPTGGKDMDTAFVVARDVDKGFAGILNAVIPGVGTAASGITQLWLDPLQQDLTKKPVVKDNKPSAFLAQGGAAGGTGTEAEKKALAEKAVLEAAASKAKADAKPTDAVLAAAAQADAAKAQTLAVEAKILLPVASSSAGAQTGGGGGGAKKSSVWPKVAIGGAIVGGLGVIALILKFILGGKS